MIEAALPPRGYIARRLVEISAMFLKGIGISEDRLILTSCLDFHASLDSIFRDIKKRGIDDVFLTGNDIKYVISKIAELLSVVSGKGARAIGLLEAFAREIAGKKTEDECIPKHLFEELATINILKANYYEYGRTYLAKPVKSYVSIDRLPMFIQLLGMLGAMLAKVGKIEIEDISYYALPPEGVSREILEVRKDEILGYFAIAREVLRRYFDAPRALLVLKLAAELVRAGCDEDLVTAELVGVQEKKRATIMSIEPISTEGLVYLIRMTGDSARELATKLGILADIALGSQDKTRDVVTRVATYLLTYSRTHSLEALYSAIALVARLSDHVARGTEEFESLARGLKVRGVEDPAEWLSRLAMLMGNMTEIE